MFSSKANHWGWGFHIDLNGNLRDAFPQRSKTTEQPESAYVKKPAKWHVKKRGKKALAGAR